MDRYAGLKALLNGDLSGREVCVYVMKGQSVGTSADFIERNITLKSEAHMHDETRAQWVLKESDMDRVSENKAFGAVIERRKKGQSDLMHLYVDDDESYYYITTFAEGWLPDLIGLLRGLLK